MQVIDQNLSARERAEIYTPLNGLLLAALLIGIFGEHFLSVLYNGMYNTPEPIPNWLSLVVRIVSLGMGAVLADVLGRRREIALAGLGLYILATVAALATNALNGYPLFIAGHLAMGCMMLPLTSALLRHTEFMGSTQKTIILSVMGLYLFNTIFSTVAFRIMEGEGKDIRLTIAGLLFIVIALVLIIVDLTHRPSPPRGQVLHNTSGAGAPVWPVFIVTFGLLALATGYLSSMTCRAFDASMWYGRPENIIVVKFFFSLFFGGVMALMFFVFKVHNYWVYILTGTTLTLIMILTGLYLGESQPLESDAHKNLGILFSCISLLGYKFIFYGFTIWMYRYAGLRFFTCIILLYEGLENIAGQLAYHYSFIPIQVYFDYQNF